MLRKGIKKDTMADNLAGSTNITPVLVDSESNLPENDIHSEGNTADAYNVKEKNETTVFADSA